MFCAPTVGPLSASRAILWRITQRLHDWKEVAGEEKDDM
jgi:hypothetical protein